MPCAEPSFCARTGNRIPDSGKTGFGVTIAAESWRVCGRPGPRPLGPPRWTGSCRGTAGERMRDVV